MAISMLSDPAWCKREPGFGDQTGLSKITLRARSERRRDGEIAAYANNQH